MEQEEEEEEEEGAYSDDAVDDFADAPDLNLSDAAGTEDQPIPLDISAALTGTDGSESLSVTLSGIPDGAVLKSGDTVLNFEDGEITFDDGVIPDGLQKL